MRTKNASDWRGGVALEIQRQLALRPEEPRWYVGRSNTVTVPQGQRAMLATVPRYGPTGAALVAAQSCAERPARRREGIEVTTDSECADEWVPSLAAACQPNAAGALQGV